jgi:predicted DNA-binding protein YlxM (UPF0122 family)
MSGYPRRLARSAINANADSSKSSMVGVLRNYCNYNLSTRQIDELLVLAASSSPTVRSTTRVIPVRVRKLTQEQIDELSSLYQQGQSLASLASRFGIHRGTVKDHLRRAGIPIRAGNQANLSETDKNEIANLYETGLSIHKLALRFGVTDNPVHHALRERGVKMRSPNEKSPTPADE